MISASGDLPEGVAFMGPPDKPGDDEK